MGAWVSGEGVERRARARNATREGKIFFVFFSSVISATRHGIAEKARTSSLRASRWCPVVCAIQCPSMLRRARAESWSSLGGVAGRGAGRCSGFITRGPNAEGAKGAARASALGWLIARVSSARARGGGVVRTRRAVRARESRPRRARARSSATRGPRGVPSGVRAGPSSFPRLVSEHATRRGRERGVAVGRIPPKRSRRGGRASIHPRLDVRASRDES